MEKIKNLGLFQKIVLVFLVVLVLVFMVVYSTTIAKEGFAYENAILVPKEENGNTAYVGKIKGEPAKFIVSKDKTVEFYHGDKIYGPYVSKEDPSAIPKDEELSDSMVGLELYEGDKILFRGGIMEHGDDRWLFNEDGSLQHMFISWGTSNGTEYDENGNIIDPMEPTIYEIIDLMAGPEMTHKGDWEAWLGGTVICIFTAVYILFADEMFRWDLAFRIRNVEQAEPSECEIAGRYIAWVVLPIIALVLFVMGLQYVS